MKQPDHDKLIEVTGLLAEFARCHDLTDGEVAMYVGCALLGYKELLPLLLKQKCGDLNVQS